jgi:hypothetical protein
LKATDIMQWISKTMFEVPKSTLKLDDNV